MSSIRLHYYPMIVVAQSTTKLNKIEDLVVIGGALRVVLSASFGGALRLELILINSLSNLEIDLLKTK